MGGDIFIPLSFLDQILSADFLSKLFKLFEGENWNQSGYFDTLPQLIKVAPIGGFTYEHFFTFARQAQQG